MVLDSQNKAEITHIRSNESIDYTHYGYIGEKGLNINVEHLIVRCLRES